MRKGALALVLVLLLSAAFASAYRWNFREAVVLSPLVYEGGKLYASSYTGAVFALDPQGGTAIWRFDTGSPVEAPPSLAASYLIAGTKEGKVYALDAATGKKLWSTNGTERVSGVLATMTLVYVSTEQGSLYALEREGGKERWRVRTNETMGRMATSGNGVFVTSGENLISLDIAGGFERWRAHAGKGWRSPPEATESIVFAGTADGTMSAFNAITGTPLWSYKTGGWIEGGATAREGAVYFGSDDFNVYALEAKSGLLLWKRSLGDAVTTKPIILLPQVGQPVLVVASNDGKVSGLSTATGELLWEINAGTRLYGGAEKGELIFMGGKNGVLALTKTGCSISDPADGELVPEGDLFIRGTARAEKGVGSVKVSVNGGAFGDASGTDKWSYTFSGADSSANGTLAIECKVTDSDGNEESPPLTRIKVGRSKDAPLRKMRVLYSGSIPQAGKLVLNVSDSRNWEPLSNFNVSYAGKAYEGRDGKAEIATSGEGVQGFVVMKAGYGDYEGAVEIGGGAVNPTLLFGLGVVALMAVGGYFLFKKPAQQLPQQ